MKKGVVLALFVLLMFANSAFASSYDSFTTSGIRAYKSGNLVQCLQQMEIAIKKNPGNAVAHYYKAISLARIGKGDDAINEYNKVISLTSNESLRISAARGIQCVKDPAGCMSKPMSDIEKLMSDKDANVKVQAINNIISDEASKKIKEQKLNRIKEIANQGIDVESTEMMYLDDYSPRPSRKKSEAPSDKEIADAVKVLSEAGMLNIGLPQTAMMQNPEMAQMAMFTQNSGNINNDMLPLMLMYQNKDKKMSPEAVKMMMSGMMTPDFGSFDNKF